VISPFTIYLILMLDNIQHLFGVLFALFLVGSLLFAVIGGLMMSEDVISPKVWVRIVVGGLSTALISLVLGHLTPTSKQAAVIFLIPAIANNETVQREAHELYDLAKQGLKTLVTPDEPAKQEPKQ
jgi:hypothetical protein